MILQQTEYPLEFPYRSLDFTRADESNDAHFYKTPRWNYHIDKFAIEALTKYYTNTLPPGAVLLDMCSSWVSHLPSSTGTSLQHVVGLGMNKEELQRNPQLQEYVVRDLNIHPELPFADNTFDVITLVVSVDYLIRPLEVFAEMHRVLKPHGLVLISQSNRCFPSKAIDIWLHTTEYEHIQIIGSYFHYAGGFIELQAEDISPRPGLSDPLYVISARKQTKEEEEEEKEKKRATDRVGNAVQKNKDTFFSSPSTSATSSNNGGAVHQSEF